MLFAALTLAAIGLGGPDVVPQSGERPGIEEVERSTEIPIPPDASARFLPGHIGLEVDTSLSVADAEAASDALPDPFRIDLIPIEGGTRIRIVHPARRVEARLHRTGGEARLSLGAESEAGRVRALGVAISRPVPRPARLGPELELWQEAEAVTAKGELQRARELWEKVKLVPTLADLAAVRVAELYVVSGHVNEAIARLRAVARRYPQSTGAALARLDLYHLDAVTGETEPSIDQIELAVQTGDRQAFESYLGLRAALIFEEIGRPTQALEHLAAMDKLPDAWTEAAANLRGRLLSQAVAAPTLRGDPLGTAVAFAALQAEVADHRHRPAILRAVVEANAHLGLFARSRVLLRELLRGEGRPADEAITVLQLADAYRGAGDLDRGDEVVSFAVSRHPTAPGLLGRVRGLALHALDTMGLPAARERLAELRDLTEDAGLRRDLLALEADLTLAYGEPPAQVQALTKLREAGWDDANAREPTFALALARAGRHSEAAPLLRKWVGRTTDAEARDRLAYRLAEVELAQDRDAEAEKILELIARSGTVYGRIARLRLTERSIAAVLDVGDAT